MAIQSSAVKELELEIAAFRKILNCSVCGERRKNTVITKCGHAFCAECVKKNVEARNRKCPGCGHQFGVNDHRSLFLT
jgi:E3 ubiquitin-protein ligase BRE1